MSNKLKHYIMKSNKLFNSLFLAFSLVIIGLIAVNHHIATSAIQKLALQPQVNESTVSNQSNVQVIDAEPTAQHFI